MVCVVIALVCATAAWFEPKRNAVSGVLIDSTVLLRSILFPWTPEDSDLERPRAIVVALDQTTLDADGFRNLPRALYGPYLAEAARKALDHGAAVVVFDFLFAFQAPKGDDTLSDAIRSYEKPLEDLFVAERRTGRAVIARTQSLLPAERYRRLFTRPAGVGLAEAAVDADGVIRRAPAALETRAHDLQPTLTGLVRSRMQAKKEGDEGPPVDRPVSWEELSPVEIAPPFSIFDLPAISLADLRDCVAPDRLRSLFEGRAVFIGGAIKVEDQVQTAGQFLANRARAAHPCVVNPVGGGRPGVFVHAAAVDGAMRGWAPKPFEAGDIRSIFASLLIAFAAALGAFYLAPWTGAIVTLVVLPAAFFVVRAWLLDTGMLLAFAAPIISAPIAFMTSLGVKTWIFDRDKRKLHKQFAKYLSDDVIEEMAATGAEPKLGGAAAEVTVMFVDLSGFTKFSEAWGPHWAGGVMNVLNTYLTIISQAVEEHGGYVDKFIGDAVMAIWNAPRPKANHASAAVAAALKIHEDVTRAASQGRHSFSVKTGIESGRVTVGNVGSPNRLEFSAIGDVVNLAARLEGANDRFRAGILVGPNAAAASEAQEGPPLLRVTSVRVKGRAAATDIFTPVGADDEVLAAAHAAALRAFDAGDFEGASAQWSNLDPVRTPWSGAMAAIAKDLSSAPPPDWTGVIVMKDK